MGNKYSEAIGKWEHKLGKITHILEPEEDDNYAFLKAKDEAQKTNSQELLYRRVGNIYYRMVERAYPSLSEEEKKELKRWISVNIERIIEDYLIAMRWSTPEKLASAKKKVEQMEEEKG